MISYTKQPHEREYRLIFKNIDREGWDPSIGTYMSDGGYDDLKKAFKMAPKEITDEVKKSGLRGRGGAGFPTGLKWSFIPPKNTKPVYLICNGDESEPGTFKDRYIVHQDPHQLIEGMIISCFATGAHKAYIYLREEFPEAALIIEKAIEEAREKGFVGNNILGSGFDLEIYVHRGAGAYICGEETGLIESLEGKRPYPRIKPPYFPAALGLYMCPTIVNNVESLCHVKHIIRMGGEEYSKLGVTRGTPGLVFFVFPETLKILDTLRSKSARSPSANCSTICAAALRTDARLRPSSPAALLRKSSKPTKSSNSRTRMAASANSLSGTSPWISIPSQHAAPWPAPGE